MRPVGSEEAYGLLMEALGRPLGWQVGAAWEPRTDGALACVEAWSAPGMDSTEFELVTLGLRLARGEGLPGSVWLRGAPEWVEDLTADPRLVRHAVAELIELRSAVCFPVRSERGVLGCIEFFSTERRAEDAELLATMDALGEQVAHMVEGRRAERALLASQRRLSAMVEAALDCVVTMDHEGRVVEFNPAAERAFGRPAAEVVGREMAELLVPEELRERHREGLRRHLETGEARMLDRRIETEGLRADGRRFPVELTITRIPVEGPPTFTGYLRDITERRHSEQELRDSRARIVRAADEARQAIERDLHDGAQQRLVNAALTLRLARRELDGAAGATTAMLDDAIEELGAATSELRELARGIHPAVLTEGGLAPAVLGLVERSPVPARILAAPQERLEQPVEAAAYFVVAEGLTNVARYSGASEATVSMVREDGHLRVEVGDDGCGGADPGRGSGLRGLADRVAALDGRLVVHSPEGGGTRVEAEIPCGS